MSEDERADLRPRGRELARLEARERRQAEVEPFVAGRLGPKAELNEEKIHRARRCVVGLAHEIDRDFFVLTRHQNVGEGFDLAVDLEHAARRAAKMSVVEEAEREALF